MADDPHALSRAESLVRGINAGATLHRTTRSAIDLGLLLGRRLYTNGADIPALTEPCSDCHSHGRCDVHALDVQTVNVVVNGPLDEDRLRRLVEGLLWEGLLPGQPADTPRATVFRIKGMLTLKDGDSARPPSRCMLQVCRRVVARCLHRAHRACMSCMSSFLGTPGSQGRTNALDCSWSAPPCSERACSRRSSRARRHDVLLHSTCNQ